MPFESFEERLKQRFDEAEIMPSAGTWPEIEDRLRPAARRQVVVWWTWSAAAGLLLLLGMWGLYRFTTAHAELRQAAPMASETPALTPKNEGKKPVVEQASPAVVDQRGSSISPQTPAARASAPAYKHAAPSLVHGPTAQEAGLRVEPSVDHSAVLAENNSIALQEIAVVSNRTNHSSDLYAELLVPAAVSIVSGNDEPQSWWEHAVEPEKPQTASWAFGAYGRQESYFAGASLAGNMDAASTKNYYIDREANSGLFTNGVVLWSVQSPGQQLSGGLVTAYKLNHNWELETGLGVFRAGRASIQAGFAEESSIPTTGNVQSGNATFISDRTFVLQGFEAPLRLRYRFGRGSWKGDFSGGTSLRLRLGSESPWISESGLSSSPLADLSDGPSDPLLSLSRTLWSGFVEAGVSRQVAPGIYMRVGPLAGFQAGNWLRGDAAVNPRPWTLGLQAGIRFR